MDNVNWQMDTNPRSRDPIMITAGADYLTQKTGTDGKLRWYDPWLDIYESTADDDDIIACRTAGPYQGRTVMAVVRDIRITNFPNTGRWIIHICKSALIEQPYRSGVPQTTINLLSPVRNMMYMAPQLRQKLLSGAAYPSFIDSYRWIDYTLLNALLSIRQVEDNVQSSSDGSTTITSYQPWEDCVANQVETIGKFFITFVCPPVLLDTR